MSEAKKAALDQADKALERDYAAAMRKCDKVLEKLTDEELQALSQQASVMSITGQYRGFYLTLPLKYLPAVYAAMEASLYTICRVRTRSKLQAARKRVEAAEQENQDPPLTEE